MDEEAAVPPPRRRRVSAIQVVREGTPTSTPARGEDGSELGTADAATSDDREGDTRDRRAGPRQEAAAAAEQASHLASTGPGKPPRL